MQKILLSIITLLLLQGCVSTGLPTKNRLSAGGGFTYPFSPQPQEVSQFELIYLDNIPIDGNFYKTNEFLKETIYSDATTNNTVAIVLYGIAKEATISVNLVRYDVLGSGITSQLIWFKKTPKTNNQWATRVIGGRSLGLNSFASQPKPKTWSFDTIKMVQEKLTQSTLDKVCYVQNIQPPLKFFENERNGWKGFGYINPIYKFEAVGLSNYSMNYEEYKTFKNLVILPVSVYSVHQNKGEAAVTKSGVAYQKTTRQGSVQWVGENFQKQISSIFGSNMGQMFLPSDEFTKQYNKLAEEHASMIGRGSVGQLFGKYQDPFDIVRRNLMKDESLKDTGVAVIGFTRYSSELNNRMGMKRTVDLLRLSINIWDVHQIPPTLRSAYSSINDDDPAMTVGMYLSVPVNQSSRAYIRKNQRSILSRLQSMIDCRIKEHGIEIEKVKLDIESYDDLLAEDI